ncbi:MAG: sulfite exporter TauE/SafE family protein [Desulfobulbaceae bacterium]|nr:sulfite exporter TauE/SafE family protein [Desulfobulbaceae bacterium]
MDIYIITGILGMITGFLSGLLGIGGGIVMAPLLLYLPQAHGLSPLPMHTVAGLTIVQGLVSCVAGVLTHRKFNFVSLQLMSWMGGTIFLTALVGGAASVFLENNFLMAVFALLAFLASILIFIPTRRDSENPDIGEFSFSRPRALTVSGSVGLLGGLVGQGGSFILIPLMTSYMQIPTRIAIGSNLAIVFLSSLAAFLGKAATGQIDWLLAVPIVLTVVPAAHIGARVSRQVPVVILRRILAACIALAAVRIGMTALG